MYLQLTKRRLKVIDSIACLKTCNYLMKDLGIKPNMFFFVSALSSRVFGYVQTLLISCN